MKNYSYQVWLTNKRIFKFNEIKDAFSFIRENRNESLLISVKKGNKYLTEHNIDTPFFREIIYL